MKFRSLILGVAGALAAGTFAQAQTTTIKITGATAFREAAVTAIRSAYTSVNYGYTGGNFGNANQAIFIGTHPDITGTLIVKTSWNGSIEGMSAVANNLNAPYLPDTTPVSSTGTANASTGTLVNETGATISFTDVSKDATPFPSLSWVGEPVAVQVFAVIGTPNIGNGANMTQKTFQTIFRNGFVSKSFITGLIGDANSFVFATGRNDGSGTRTVYMAEANIGDAALNQSYRANTVSQFRIEGSAPHAAITLWPTGDGNNASTIWAPDIFEGNGGYSSGSTLRGLMDNAFAANVTVQNPDLSPAFTVSAPNTVSMVTSISAVDAAAAISAGAKFLSWNGVSIVPRAADVGGLDVNDRYKVASGQYSLWSYEYVYSLGLTGQAAAFFTRLVADCKLPANIGGNGLALSEMLVERNEEGAFIIDIP